MLAFWFLVPLHFLNWSLAWRILNITLLACAWMHAKSPHLCPTLCDPMDWWTVVCQAPLSMGFSRREYWSGWPCPLSGDLPDSGIENVSLTSPALAGRFFTTSTTWEAHSPGRWVQLFRVLRILYYHPSWELGWGLTFSSSVATAGFPSLLT